MDTVEFLVTCSSVGVAFAGFAGIVAVIGARATGGWRAADVVRFWQMIEISLMATLMPLVPFVFSAMALAESVVWASSSAMLALVQAIQLIRALWRTIRVGRSDASVSIAFSLPYALVGLVVIALLVANAAGLVYEGTAAPFLAGIFWQICLAAVLFWRLLKFSDIPYQRDEFPPPDA
jgi:hypothetical protein